VVVSSPHCYYTFKNEYPELGAQFEVMHYTQYLAQLAREGKLRFTKEIKRKVAYTTRATWASQRRLRRSTLSAAEHTRIELVEMRTSARTASAAAVGVAGCGRKPRRARGSPS